VAVVVVGVRWFVVRFVSFVAPIDASPQRDKLAHKMYIDEKNEI